MVKVFNLEKSFGKKSVLNKLSLSIGRHDVYGLLGPNGSGKTTIINILCNLLDADAGKILINGEPISEQTKHLIGFVPQENSLYQDLTCKENLLFFASIYGLRGSERSKRIAELIQMLNLDSYKNTRVSKLSGGWRRRVTIAAALIHSPGILILDEPTAGLDIEARYQLWELIKNLKDSGVSILLTTHRLEESEHLCSRIGVLHKGGIVAEGSVEQLRRFIPAKQLAIIESDDEQSLINKAQTLGWEHRHYGGKLMFFIPNQLDIKEIINIFDGIPISSVALQDVGLEHVYFELTHEKSSKPDNLIFTNGKISDKRKI